MQGFVALEQLLEDVDASEVEERMHAAIAIAAGKYNRWGKFKMAIVALIVGLLLVAWSVFFDTTVGGTHNLGYLQHQVMILHTGLALLIISAIRWQATSEAFGLANRTDEEVERGAAMNRRGNYVAFGAVALLVLFGIYLFAIQ